jgi:hypothetical protein
MFHNAFACLMSPTASVVPLDTLKVRSLCHCASKHEPDEHGTIIFAGIHFAKRLGVSALD